MMNKKVLQRLVGAALAVTALSAPLHRRQLLDANPAVYQFYQYVMEDAVGREGVQHVVNAASNARVLANDNGGQSASVPNNGNFKYYAINLANYQNHDTSTAQSTTNGNDNIAPLIVAVVQPHGTTQADSESSVTTADFDTASASGNSDYTISDVLQEPQAVGGTPTLQSLFVGPSHGSGDITVSSSLESQAASDSQSRFVGDTPSFFQTQPQLPNEIAQTSSSPDTFIGDIPVSYAGQPPQDTTTQPSQDMNKAQHATQALSQQVSVQGTPISGDAGSQPPSQESNPEAAALLAKYQSAASS